MLRNYFKIAWINLFRHKGFSITNILGLTIGMVCTIFILLWVWDELTFDKDQKNYKTIYQVLSNRSFNNDVFTDANIAFPLAKALQDNYPGIKNAVVTSGGGSHVFSYGDKKLKKNGMFVSDRFFDVFSWKFIKGNAQTAIHDQSTIVLTESMAKALFDDVDPIGQVLKIDKDLQAKVTAVITDPPGNSSFDFEYIEPYDTKFEKIYMQEWVNSFSNVYIDAAPGTDVKTANKILNEVMSRHVPDDKISNYFAFPMSDWHLKSDFKGGVVVGGMIEYVRLFFIIAIIILLIACINFMNLSTARSEKKSKEVGVRKTLGSSRKQLVLQFFCESVLLTLIAFVFSIGIVLMLLPAFNSLVNKHLDLMINQPYVWLVAGGIVVFTGLVSGSYPALYLSSFNPAGVLKGKNLTGKKALLPRRILVTVQFVVSILLISSTIIVFQQIQLVKNRPTGYNSENLIMLPASEDLEKNFAVVKQELLSSGSIEGITRTSSPVTDIWWSTPAPDWKGKPKNGDIIFTGIRTDADFAKVVGLKVLKGNYFKGMPSDTSAMILNRTAVETMGLKDPIGMEMFYASHKYTVIGVVDDIVIESPYKAVSPLMIVHGRHPEYLTLRLNKDLPVNESIKMVEEIIKKYNPVYPFEYEFVNSEFNKKFLTEELIGKLTNIFAALAIFICCIGLGGLTVFTIEKRKREIGMRKVLGATLAQLVMLISNEFIKLVFIAFVITIPLTWLLMNKWLQNYTFHVDISIFLFVAVGLIVLALTLLIVFLNTLKTAGTNPVKNLRSE
ncbi:MAG: FtsX-like permease family protein [Bacteroidetes bacterium]|nr:FtsX-like permease family protein [Bacteroidota bacterium]